ncbi:MAG: hypothetical protein RR495_04105 [Anaerovoracaceae bacterium]
MKKTFLIALIIIAVLIAVLIIWFIIPYSPLKAEFKKEKNLLTSKSTAPTEYFSKEVLADKPQLLKNFIAYCGLMGKPMMSSSVTKHSDVDFLMNPVSPTIKIDYTQVNVANSPERLAFIDTKMAGILPFQGLDDYINGKARMQGVIGKLFTIFNVQNQEMNQSSLVTVLAEAIVCPSFFMQKNIIWKEIDNTHLQATITAYETTVSGIYEFDANGAITSFYSKDRYKENGEKTKQHDWVARCGKYKEVGGINMPTVFQGAWVLPDGTEELYFDCDKVDVAFYY